jgi:hypothetical protein
MRSYIRGRDSHLSKFMKRTTSLDQPDSAIDKLWAKETEDRIDAYEAGEMEAISAEEVFKKYEKL